MVDSVYRDARYALRAFRRTPAPFVVAVIALALATGPSTAGVRGVARGPVRPPPYPARNRPGWLGMEAPISQNEFLLEGDYRYFREHQQVFEATSSFSRTGECDLNEAEPVRLVCAQVGADFLPMLGMQPIIGRNFTAAEDQPNGPHAALLSWGFWQRRFGGDPGVLGRQLVISGRPAQIAGVLPRSFEMPNLAPADVLLPQQLSNDPRAAFTFLTVIARLKPGIQPDQARDALLPLYQDRLKMIPAGFVREVTFHLSPLRDRQVRESKTASWVLLGCVLALLLIACANVANLLM